MPEAAGLFYETHGDPANPPLILSSGLGGSAGYWAPNVAALATRFHVIAYDHRGTGRSDRALPDASIGAMASDVLALLDALGIERADVIGHALGGHVALELARTAPERAGRLVVINGWSSLDPQTARCFDVRLTLLRSAGARAYLQAQPLFLFPATWLSDHDAQLCAELETHLAHWPGDATIEARITAVAAFDASAWLHEIGSPVLFVCAVDDLLVPWTCSARMVERLGASAELVRFAHGGHACNVTEAERFNEAVLGFLTT
ncbi:pyrimidine utilization protein D [Novosphingobium sp. 9U]|uniref:pyrimidine utilization protein D n=1 Tax=Novosphingobium sp. 9U TaxID=2653158 RepID=UPI0012F14F45|nr:pyrimidine utilization protein D [Novosphingobium sp. 9U]VWX46643.1 enzyme of the alternative pyrimidine degradation pathway [Novosphingobium sp. 9U]